MQVTCFTDKRSKSATKSKMYQKANSDNLLLVSGYVLSNIELQYKTRTEMWFKTTVSLFYPPGFDEYAASAGSVNEIILTFVLEDFLISVCSRT